MPPGPAKDPAAGAELCALLQRLKQACGLSYDELAAEAAMSRNTVINYVTKLGHRRDTRTLEQLLAVLGADGADRNRALELHRRTQPTAPDAADVG
jgi:transcriptional regulator with XRE-family HTH domain